jgi:hypothetical protein
MRDDLHKSAPVGQKWKNFLRSCNTPADRGAITEQRCRHALVADCHRELSPKFVSEMMRLANEPAGLLGSKLGYVRGPLELGGTGSVLEEQVFARARMADRDGGFDAAACEAAFSGSIGDRKEAQVWAVHGHVLRAEGKDKHVCLAEIRRSASRVSALEVARELMANGGRIPDSRRAVPVVSLDEIIPDPR